MADVILFSSGALAAKRIAVIADDAVTPPPVRLEIRDAANALVLSHVLTVEDKLRILGLWEVGVDNLTQLKTTNPQLWVTMDKNNVSVWTGALAADVDSVSEEIALTADQTSTLVGWVEFGYVA